jgi:hypothetical protein
VATTVLEPPTSEEELLEHAEQLKEDVDEALADEDLFAAVIEEAEHAKETEQTEEAQRVKRGEMRGGGFNVLRTLIRAVTKSPVWRAHDLARELLVTLEDLQDAIEDDPDATDPDWRQREALMRMRVVVEAMIRQLQHHAIDRPEVAAQFVAEELRDVGDTDIARLLDTTPRMVGKYREQGVKEIRKDPNRITLIGQLVYELGSARTPRGVLLWFDAPREALGGRRPLELIEEDVASAHEALISLARGGRGQLDVGGRADLE